eukprot:TRINITY_DN16551_c0_g1_i2.p1 TRINITY_DN16551_c0_g1~~TRINITY_DN16551_c0_g1_i2.p1  ORF type:complete len:459 (-),score=85.97 TRINITY_DN16551_c0_g1_i2:97-1473(-)
MGTWSGDEQPALHDINMGSQPSINQHSSTYPPELSGVGPTTVLSILKERHGWSQAPPPAPSSPEQQPIPQQQSHESCTSDQLMDPEFESEFDRILAMVSPTANTKQYRAQVYVFVAQLLQLQPHCIQVCGFGSVPLETYLPDGDIDLCAFFTCEASVGLAAIHQLLQREVQNENSCFQIESDPQLVFAGVPVVKCIVGNIPIDISANQVRGLSAVCFLNSLDMVIGSGHLFKRSIIAIKVWCGYESRILGSQGGLLPSYAVEIMVLNILSRYEECKTPAAVLLKFLQCYAEFRWEKSHLTLPAHSKLTFGDQIEMYRSDLDGTQDDFVPKFMNIVDPLDKANNLGRSVNQASFLRTRHALNLGAKRMKYHMGRGCEGARSFLQSTCRLIKGQFKQRPDVQPQNQRWPISAELLGQGGLEFALAQQHLKLEQLKAKFVSGGVETIMPCLLYTSPSPRDS